jgi:hypothetical protein
VKQIDLLQVPDDVLLEIFDIYMIMNSSHGGRTGSAAWQSLVHVCRRWRSLVFLSPRRLNLRLFCTPKTPARDKLDIWPSLPLLIGGLMTLASGTDNIIAALEQSDRVCKITLRAVMDWQLEKVLATMQVPFPELTDLQLFSNGKALPVIPIPDSFLGGSAPRLRHFELDGFSFPGLLKLLSSATHFVYLRLVNIPHSGYISPEAILALLSVVSSLETLILEFRSPQSRPHREIRHSPSLKRSVIPALKFLRFKGVIEYLEDLVTVIDAPKLNVLSITFFNQIDFDTPRLAQFINRTPKFRTREAQVEFDDSTASITLRYRRSEMIIGDLLINISCREPDWQLSSVAQVCNSSLPPLTAVEDLYIDHDYLQLIWKNDAIEDTLWLELLLPFTAVKNLYICKEFAPGIAAALQELVGGRITEVLPSLQNIFVEGLEPSGPFQESIRHFVTARQLSGHPGAISVRVRNNPVWNQKEEEEESALSCMHSTLSSIGRKADVVACAQRNTDEIGEGILGLHELGIVAEFGLFSLSSPKRLLEGKRNAKDPNAAWI